MIDVVFQVFVALAAVIFLIYALSFAAKKRRGSSGFLGLLEYLSLGPKRGIAVVKVGKRAIVLGVTQTDFKLLKTLGEQEVEAIAFKKTLNAEMSKTGSQLADTFNRIVRRLSGKTGKDN
ncbi:FliO/MopB family protein [Candidatus Magnetominusculus xianensis]|uniref:Flagellar biosynthesis protein FliO n=1 Tax=Candidatus Magnetominusculus xianensis TaxID=1748249 RepID=A0ABR5SFN2_9BACT|nr:flagellar biosynthetic protein FliO [Candidatus Magnetominusculus xianensis]KWT84091.1 putative flagellar biosynthesis protein FliO [Candidatus Magnetominusculus xianensis]MBF0402384.1 flagellar biosynthetic protein FliO [Nitrospirota bacterium]